MITSKSRHPLYQTYSNARSRCYNKNHREYKYYGKRKIVMCEGWLNPQNGFQNFIRDIGPKPKNNYSLDRINNDGNYSCGYCQECVKNNWDSNCRWTSKEIQSTNQRSPIGKTGYKGVTFRNGKFVATISIKSRMKHLGTYTTPEEANLVYLEAKKNRDIKYLSDSISS